MTRPLRPGRLNGQTNCRRSRAIENVEPMTAAHAAELHGGSLPGQELDPRETGARMVQLEWRARSGSLAWSNPFALAFVDDNPWRSAVRCGGVNPLFGSSNR